MRLCCRVLSLVSLLPLAVCGAGHREVNVVQSAAAAQMLAIVGARLIDGHGGDPVEDAVVVVRGDRVVAAGPRARVAIPAEATRLEAAGLSKSVNR